MRLGQRPSRFQAAWLTHRQFNEFVQTNWPSEGGLAVKLGQFGNQLKQWNKEVFGHIGWQKKRLHARLAVVQRLLALRPTTYDEAGA